MNVKSCFGLKPLRANSNHINVVWCELTERLIIISNIPGNHIKYFSIVFSYVSPNSQKTRYLKKSLGIAAPTFSGKNSKIWWGIPNAMNSALKPG